MGAGMTHVAVSPSEPSKLRWLVPVFGLVATTAVIYFAWAYRYGRPHIDAARPITDAPSATADLPLDDEEDIDPAPPLASGSSSVPRPSKRKKPPPSTSAGPSLSAALAEIGSATPPPQPKSSFDRPGAVIALHAVDIQKCATPDGPKGPSRLTVFYGNDGLPKQFFFDRRGPYPGTAAEMCISALLRSAHVDPFTGPMQAVVIQINLR
jgi:hypothetical protein